jgi:Domain of unknown function (DUF397)
MTCGAKSVSIGTFRSSREDCSLSERVIPREEEERKTMEPPANPRWIKSSLSAGIGACVEFAPHGDMIALRDSKHPDVLLHFTQLEVFAFIDGAKRGEFDHLVEL